MLLPEKISGLSHRNNGSFDHRMFKISDLNEVEDTKRPNKQPVSTIHREINYKVIQISIRSLLEAYRSS